MTDWTLPNRCTAVDSQGRRCLLESAHSFAHVPEDVPGITPGPGPTNWIRAIVLAALGIGLAGLVAVVLQRF